MVKDGYKFAAAPLLVGVAAVVFHWNWLGGVLIFLGLFVLFFFRDPERTPPPDLHAIVSPADGRIMEIVEESRGDKLGRRISVFLSIFDVHVNRSPVAGRITAIEYRTGKFYAAMRGRAPTVPRMSPGREPKFWFDRQAADRCAQPCIRGCSRRNSRRWGNRG